MLNKKGVALLIMAICGGSVGAMERVLDSYECSIVDAQTVKPGQVYVLGKTRPHLVCDLLSRIDLHTDRAWLDHNANGAIYSSVISSIPYSICKRGRWTNKHAETLCHGTESEIVVRGEQQLPEIVNRACSGLPSNRSSEQQIVQYRRQLSAAMASQENGSGVVGICVGVRKVTNPEIQFVGYAINNASRTKEYAVTLMKECGVTCSGVQLDEKEGKFTVGFKGEMIIEANFRVLQEGDASSFRESGFYLGRSVTLKIPAIGTTMRSRK